MCRHGLCGIADGRCCRFGGRRSDCIAGGEYIRDGVILQWRGWIYADTITAQLLGAVQRRIGSIQALLEGLVAAVLPFAHAKAGSAVQSFCADG